MKTLKFLLLTILVISMSTACTKGAVDNNEQQEKTLREIKALRNTLLGEWTEVLPSKDGCVILFRGEGELIFYRNIYEGFNDMTTCSYEVISGESVKFTVDNKSTDYKVIVSDNDNIVIKNFIPSLAAVFPPMFGDIVLRRLSESEEDIKEEPNEISFTEYLIGESCQWKCSPYNIGDTVVIINSQEDLEKYLECMDENSVIDFSTHTLLFAHGIAPSSVVNVSCSSLQQTSEHKYRMNVDIVVGDATVLSNWQVPIIINKLRGECIIELIVTTKFHSL